MPVGELLFSGLSGLGQTLEQTAQDQDRRLDDLKKEAQKADYYRKLVVLANPDKPEMAEIMKLASGDDAKATLDAMTIREHQKTVDLHNKELQQRIDLQTAMEQRNRQAEAEMPGFMQALQEALQPAEEYIPGLPPPDQTRTGNFATAAFAAGQRFPNAFKSVIAPSEIAAALREDQQAKRSREKLMLTKEDVIDLGDLTGNPALKGRIITRQTPTTWTQPIDTGLPTGTAPQAPLTLPGMRVKTYSTDSKGRASVTYEKIMEGGGDLIKTTAKGVYWSPGAQQYVHESAPNIFEVLKAAELDKAAPPPSAPTQSTISAPPPARIRVREKATGKLGWWEGGQPPSGYEIIK